VISDETCEREFGAWHGGWLSESNGMTVRRLSVRATSMFPELAMVPCRPGDLVAWHHSTVAL